MKKAVVLALFAVFILMFLPACFSEWKGDKGSFSVSIGGTANSRGVGIWTSDPNNLKTLFHTITVSSNSGETIKRTFNMDDGIISGNEAGWNGGGVFFTYNSTIHKTKPEYPEFSRRV